MKNIKETIIGVFALLIGLTIVSCSSDDDNSTGTTDPLIDTWTTSYTELGVAYNDSYKTNSNGTYIYTKDDEYTETGKWSNDGTDFNFLNQSYSLTIDNSPVSGYNITARFSSDFNSFEFFEEEDNVYIRQ